MIIYGNNSEYVSLQMSKVSQGPRSEIPDTANVPMSSCRLVEAFNLISGLRIAP